MGGSSGTWGTTLNADLDSIDSQVKAVSDATTTAATAAAAAQTTANTAVAALAAITETAVTATGSGTTFAATIDCSAGAVQGVTVTTNAASSTVTCTLTFTNRPATTGKFMWLRFITQLGTNSTINYVVAAGSGQFALGMFVDTASSGAIQIGTQTHTGSGLVTRQYVVPLYILGS